MRAVDFRNLTWAQVQEHIGDDLRRVHEAWEQHGPGTTRQVAERSGISLLTLRPRTTDLFQLGMVACVGGEGSEGVYRHVPVAVAQEMWLHNRSLIGTPRRPRATDRARPPTRSEISHAASILARALAHRRAKPTGRTLTQPELFSAA